MDFRRRRAVAGNAQHIERLERTVRHQRHGIDRAEPDRVGQRQLPNQAADHRIERIDIDAERRIFIEPDVEQPDEVIVDRRRIVGVRRVRRQDVELRIAELVDDKVQHLLRIGARIAHRDQPGVQSGGAQEGQSLERLRQRASPFEVDAIFVVDLGRAIEADGDADVVHLEQRDPLVVDKDRIGGEAALDHTAGALFDLAQLFQEGVEPPLRKQQRLAAMKHQEEKRQAEFADVLFETKAKSIFGFGRQHRGLRVNHRVAKPVAIGAFDVAARRELDQNKGKRTLRQGRS